MVFSFVLFATSLGLKISLSTESRHKIILETMNKLLVLVVLAAAWPSVSANAASSNSRSVAGSLIVPCTQRNFDHTTLYIL